MDLNMIGPQIRQMREEITRFGFEELRSAQDVDAKLPVAGGTTVVFVNSVCGCAGGIARPGMGLALQSVKPDHLYTVFAGQDKDATEKARSLFTGYQPSSPSIAILKDGKIATLIERHQIEGTSPQAVAAKVVEAVRAVGAAGTH